MQISIGRIEHYFEKSQDATSRSGRISENLRMAKADKVAAEREKKLFDDSFHAALGFAAREGNQAAYDRLNREHDRLSRREAATAANFAAALKRFQEERQTSSGAHKHWGRIREFLEGRPDIVRLLRADIQETL